ncbi:MAG: lytic murein transglycosylase [Pseudomonadota bacterium]
MRFFSLSLSSLTLALVALVAMPLTVAEARSFSQCVASKWPAAQRIGVTRANFVRATQGLQPDTKTTRLVNKQAEFVKPIWEYLDSAVSATRVKNGRAMLRKYSKVLDEIERRFEVDREAVIAIWGMETSYGSFMGDHNAVQAAATLACKSNRRNKFWSDQFVAAIKIAQDGHVPLSAMRSSWGAAMGHTQFIPTSWQAYAADYDGDGKRDIWRSIPDALASTANYLKKHGWRYQQTWGYEVSLPRNFNHKLADDRTRSLSEWSRLGVKRTNDRPWPRPNDKAYLKYMAGATGPAFLILPNFNVIKRYNNADAYALGVGHLADRIIGGGGFAKAWPRDQRPLRRAEVREMQSLLTRRGFSTGGVDGKVGPNTRRAIRQFQSSRGLVADGFPSTKVLNQLKRL